VEKFDEFLIYFERYHQKLSTGFLSPSNVTRYSVIYHLKSINSNILSGFDENYYGLQNYLTQSLGKIFGKK